LKENDTLRRFVFERANVRGAFIHLDATWRALLERKEYPEPVANQLGRFMAAGALLSSTIKFEGSLIMQIQSKGPISMLVVEATSERTLRGTAKWDESTESLSESTSYSELFSQGQLVLTIDSGNSQDRYQGIIELEGGSLAETLEAYFIRSEQLETQVWLSVSGQSATGMLIQKMPGGEDYDQDAWNRIQTLAGTVTDQELTNLSAMENIQRLFAEEDVRLFDGEPVSFRCSCSRERVSNMLRTLGIDEVHGIIDEQGSVSVNCEYCSQEYVFDKVDAEALFAASIPTEVPKTRH